MKTCCVLALSAALLAAPAPLPAAASAPLAEVAAARPAKNIAPADTAPLRCIHPISGHSLAGADCAALLSALLLAALAQKSPAAPIAPQAEPATLAP